MSSEEEAWLAPVALGFYGAAAGTGDFGHALDQARQSLEADTLYYYVARLDDALRRDQHVLGRVTRDRIEEYARDWVVLNTRQRFWPEVRDGSIVDFDTIVPAAEFAASRLWRDFMRHHVPMLHCFGLAISHAPGLQARFAIGRTPESGPFPDRVRARLAVLAPHIRRAATARLHLLGLEAETMLPEAAVAALDLALARYAADGTFLGANASLRRLVARREGLDLGPAGIEPARARDRAALGAAIRSATAPTRIALHREGAVPYIAEVLPGQEPGEPVLVVITDPAAPPGPSPDHLAVLFDIPPAQAVLAYDIAGGMTLREHAAERGVPVETARSRLKAVMARLGCRRQAELAALLARLPALS